MNKKKVLNPLPFANTITLYRLKAIKPYSPGHNLFVEYHTKILNDSLTYTRLHTHTLSHNHTLTHFTYKFMPIVFTQIC